MTFPEKPITTGVPENSCVNHPPTKKKLKSIMKMRNTTISLFRGFADKNPKKANLYKALVTKKFKSEIEALRAEPDPAKQKELKRRLPSFSVSGVFTGGHKKENLSTPSNFICIDIDQHDNTNIRNFSEFKKLAEAIPWVAYCGLSCRGKGFFMVIPYKDSTKHEKYFEFLEKLFSLYGVVIDPACKDISRLRFVSYDEEPYINEDAIPFDYVLPDEPALSRNTDSALKEKGEFNLVDWLERNGVSYTPKSHSEAEGGTGYLVECPWSENHTTDNPHHPDPALVFQRPDGKLCFHCFHSHCTGHDWREYRSWIELKSDFQDITEH